MFFELKFWIEDGNKRTPICHFHWVHSGSVESVVCFMVDNFSGCRHSCLPIHSILEEIWTNEAVEKKIHIL